MILVYTIQYNSISNITIWKQMNDIDECQYNKCDNSPIDNSSYCKDHKCSQYKCLLVRSILSEYCLEHSNKNSLMYAKYPKHKCQHEYCYSEVAIGYFYCKYHTCDHDNCRSCHHDGVYCLQHK